MEITITPNDVAKWTPEQAQALDTWADDQDVYLYGWISLTMHEEEGRITVKTQGFGCSTWGYDEDDVYHVSVPPPIPAEHLQTIIS